ncbi:uncharacterized protein LOC119550637 [Drosophila subpulchrella]|uniref:uncharacterized protein LOC119550637 n=1 Tax=Drosophila subpulchrella TaxID=1486046 RepID=UPI0018A1531B|nr:uncharacterized protein LOC119550637 [Drosophila subpulchrella]
MKTMSMRIWSHSTVALPLMAMVILASVGQSTGRTGGLSVYRPSDSNDPWSRRHYSSERRDEKDWRDMPPAEPRYLSDPEILFQRLDDMEQAKTASADKLSPSGKEKPENFLLGAKNIGTQLFKENLSQSQGMGDDELKQEMEDPFESLARMNYNEQALDHKSDRELKRMLSYYRRKDRDEKPDVATANLLAKVISSKADRPKVSMKSQTCTAAHPISTMRSTTTTRRTTRSTTTRSPSTFCLPEASPDGLVKPMPSTPPPCLSPRPPTIRKPCGESAKSSKSPIKSKSKKHGGSKKLLDIILSTKQHALSALKILNHLEMELLSQSADDDMGLGSTNKVKGQPMPKNNCERLEQPLKPPHHVFSFGIRPASQKESMYDLALAREEELKLEDRVWEEHKQQMKLRRPVKSKRFEAAPSSAARLEPFQEPRKPQQSLNALESAKPESPAQDRRINLEALSVVVKPAPPVASKDSPSPSARWNPSFMPRAEMKAIRVEGPVDDDLQQSKVLQTRKRKKKKHKLYMQEQRTDASRFPIAGVFY